MGKKLKILVRVRYSECDAQNVMFNARYGDYVDLAVMEFYRELFGGYEKLIEQGIDSQVVRLMIDWQSSAKFDDVISISVESLHIGNSSYSFSLEFHDYYTNRAIAISEITYAMVTPLKHENINMPDDFRKAIENGTGTEIVNLAGVEIKT